MTRTLNEKALMIARLQRFYGGDPVAWREKMPQIRLIEFAEAIPILVAEERLAFLNDLVCGNSVTVPKSYFNKHQKRLDRASTLNFKKPLVTPEQRDAMLASMGIEVVHV